MATTKTGSERVDHARSRVRERAGQDVAGVIAEQYLVDVVLGATMSMMPNLRLDRLVELLGTLAVCEAIAKEADGA